MDFMDLTWERQSIRAFKADEVPIEKINKLLEAARSAPSGGNCQPWHFFVIRDSSVKQRIHDESCNQGFILTAPVHIVVCADLPRTSERYGERGRTLYCLQDTGAAIQNLLLCAAEEGLGTCWCGAFDESAMSRILGLDANLRPIALIPVGYPDQKPNKRPRRPLEEIATFIG